VEVMEQNSDEEYITCSEGDDEAVFKEETTGKRS